MKNSDVGRSALSISIGAALLTGCGGSQLPVGASGAMAQSRSIAAHSSGGKSWMLPELSGTNLLYLSDDTAGDIYVLSYPQGKLVGTLSGLSAPTGLCSDRNGNVFVADYGAVVEYAHGGTSPIATLEDPGTYAEDCAVDPETNDLAVVNFTGRNGHGDVIIYPDEKDDPIMYSDPQMADYTACAYDGSGNLFVDGYDGTVSLAELPKGRGSFINLSVPFGGLAGMQWDGKYLAIASYYYSSVGEIFRESVSGSKVTGHGAVVLQAGKNPVRVVYFALQGKRLLGPSGTSGSFIGYWKYPKGRQDTKLIKGYTTIGVALSLSTSPGSRLR
jgi:hypothetical protein